MAACTTASGTGWVSWPATSPHAPRAAIARGPFGARRVTTPATFRRRRLAVALLALAVVVVAARAGVALGGTPLAAPERRPASSATTSIGARGPAVVVVHPGDTLWSIATRLAPDEDPRPIVDALAAAHGTTLLPGERLRLPD
jgi:Tfp pilus assembly protein FimV